METRQNVKNNSVKLTFSRQGRLGRFGRFFVVFVGVGPVLEH